MRDPATCRRVRDHGTDERGSHLYEVHASRRMMPGDCGFVQRLTAARHWASDPMAAAVLPAYRRSGNLGQRLGELGLVQPSVRAVGRQ
jgi:hypothetical protein